MAEVRVINAKKIVKEKAEEAAAAAKRKVAGYARVSTDRDEQQTSYEAQVEYYTGYIKARSDWEFVGVYTDEGITGTSTKHRTGFNRMIRDALDGKIDLIVTKSVSRFARNTIDSLTTIRRLKEKGTEVYFEKENIWTLDGKGELLITIMSSLAQEESRSISENVTWGMRESMRKGRSWVPYKVFLGYDKGPGGEMVVNREQARLVRRIYGMYLQGFSPYQIGVTLEAEGIEFSEGKKRWYPTTIYSILQNEKYKGDALCQKTYSKDFLTKERAKNEGELQQFYISGHHEPIVSPDVFERVQTEIAKREGAELKRGGNKVFSKRIRCNDCGGWYGPVVWAPRTGHEKLVWRCNRKYAKDKPNCAPPAVTESEIKTAFVRAFDKLAARYRNRIINAFLEINEALFGTGVLEGEKNVLEDEAGRIERASIGDSLPDQERLTALKSRLFAISKEIGEKRARRETTASFLREYFGRDALVSEFYEDAWYSLAECLTVTDHDDITVRFRSGEEVKV